LSNALSVVFGWAAAGGAGALLLAELLPRMRGSPPPSTSTPTPTPTATITPTPTSTPTITPAAPNSPRTVSAWWLVVAGAILLLPFLLIAAFNIETAHDSAQNAEYTADRHSGRYDFGEQPALLAVANAIDRNDEAAIRAAAKKVPNLQAAGREGKTLLCFAVEEVAWRPELEKAVAVLLSCGADPNYNNGQPDSFALARAAESKTVSLLRIFLDAGANPNGTDFRGSPIIFLQTRYTMPGARERLRLLLDRGADVNSTLPPSELSDAGITLLMRLAWLGQFDSVAYTDALDLLERGADFKRTAKYGLTLIKILAKQRESFSAEGKPVPPEYEKLCDWLRQHGAILEER